jgi:hypothetical protein
MKQTLEGTYDPGAVLLDGPNVRFTKSAQLLSKSPSKVWQEFELILEFDTGSSLGLKFAKKSDGPLDLAEMTLGESDARHPVVLSPGLSHEKIVERLPGLRDAPAFIFAGNPEGHKGATAARFTVQRQRCFLVIGVSFEGNGSQEASSTVGVGRAIGSAQILSRHLIHVPGLRGNPARTYKTTAVGATFPGTFEEYAASIVRAWQSQHDDRIQTLGKSLAALGLTWKVLATPVNETEVEIEVGQLPTPRQGGARDLVSIADVGFGVSQVLPVIVALLVAAPGQVVYLEQPEIHLHPRAQVALGQILVDAANRGVRVIVETHSDLLLRAVQTLVATDQISNDKVIFHWFARSVKDGMTKISSAEPDKAGAFGDWPEDFDDVYLKAEGAYLDAAQARHLGR